MSTQFKFSDAVDDDRRLEILEALGRAGFGARRLYPGQTRPKLASIFTVAKANAKDIKALRAALLRYGREIEYVEAAPERSLKT
jgi:hypothetical protein